MEVQVGDISKPEDCGTVKATPGSTIYLPTAMRKTRLHVCRHCRDELKS